MDGPRNCVLCGAPDREVPLHGETDENGAQKIDHFVKPDVAYISSEVLDPKYIRQGWRYFNFQSRHAMWRYSCEDCINKSAEAEDCWSELRQAAKDIETDKMPPTYYNALCGDWH